MYEVSTKIYQKSAPQGEGAPQADGGNSGENAQGAENVYNADYKDVDSENK